MSQGLPAGWEKVLDRTSGQYYFFNARLGVTQWDPPQVGAQKTKATFVTTTTTRKVVKKPRPAPVAYQHTQQRTRNPAFAVQTTTVHQTQVVGGGGGPCCTNTSSCDSGDAIFISALVAIVLVIVVCMNTVGKGTNDRYSANIESATPFGPTTNSVSTNGGCGATDEQCVQLTELVTLVNNHRISIGVNVVTSNTMLNTAAQRHSCYMAAYSKMSHTGGPQQDDREMSDRVHKTGYKYIYLGENVAAAQKTAQNVMAAWLNSNGHRRNIESTNFKEIGVGLRTAEDGDRYWTQVFATQQTTAKKGATNDACLKELPGL